MPKLYRLTRNGKEIASFHANQVDENDTRLKDSVALAVIGRESGAQYNCIMRGKVSRYTDGAIIVAPCRSNGLRCRDVKGNQYFYTLSPYYKE